MNLKKLSNDQLVFELKSKVKQELALQMEVLHLLAEMERRRAYLGRGYRSLFAFATEELGYTPGVAARRIDSMRLMRLIPEVEQELASGNLSLDNAARAQSYFKLEAKQGAPLLVEEKREVVEELLGKSSRDGERLLAERAPDLLLPPERLKPLPKQRTLVQFVAEESLIQKLGELQELLGHQINGGGMSELIEKLADISLKRLKPKSPRSSPKAVSETVSNEANLAPAPEHSRYIPVQDRREMEATRSDGCAYQDPKSGHRCGSKYALQLDHRVPFAHGGRSCAENLQWLCGPHNRFRAEQMGLSLQRRSEPPKKSGSPPFGGPPLV